MNRSWVRFPQAAQIRPPGTGWAFLYALTGRAALCALGRRPAREIATREPDGSEWSISRPALALPPPTGTAARPSGVLHTSGAGSLTCGAARRLDARPGPATAHRHHGQAVQSPPVSPASQYLPHRQRWGFCSIRRWLAACRTPNDAIPPFGGRAVRLRGLRWPSRRTVVLLQVPGPKCRPPTV